MEIEIISRKYIVKLTLVGLLFISIFTLFHLTNLVLIKKQPLVRFSIIEFFFHLTIIFILVRYSISSFSRELIKLKEDLEILIEKRTKQLREKQVNQLMQVRVFANYGKIVSGILHDISNPLTIISLSLDSLKLEKNIPNKALLNDANQALENIQSIIKYSRKLLIDSSVSKDDDVSLCVCEELKKTTRLFQHHFTSKKIHFEVICPEIFYVFGPKTIFSQIISNLLINSIESFDEDMRKDKKIKIIVGKAKTKFKKYFEIKVIDNGSGIEKNIQQKVFYQMYTTKHKVGGTGLGLYYCKSYISQFFNGEISLKSDLKKGTTVTLKIPYQAN